MSGVDAGDGAAAAAAQMRERRCGPTPSHPLTWSCTLRLLKKQLPSASTSCSGEGMIDQTSTPG